MFALSNEPNFVAVANCAKYRLERNYVNTPYHEMMQKPTWNIESKGGLRGFCIDYYRE